MTDSTNRGQSSIVGSILLLGLVVVGTTLVGGYGLYTLTQTADSSEHFVDCEIGYADDAVVVTQTGGDRVDEAALNVVFRNASGESRAGFAIDDGDGDTVFETGESARLGSLGSRTEVLVVTEQSVICRATVTPTDGAGDDAGDEGGDDADESEDEGRDDESDDADESDDPDESEDERDDDADESEDERDDDYQWWWEWWSDDGDDGEDANEDDGDAEDGGWWSWRGWLPW